MTTPINTETYKKSYKALSPQACALLDAFDYKKCSAEDIEKLFIFALAMDVGPTFLRATANNDVNKDGNPYSTLSTFDHKMFQLCKNIFRVIAFKVFETAPMKTEDQLAHNATILYHMEKTTFYKPYSSRTQGMVTKQVVEELFANAKFFKCPFEDLIKERLDDSHTMSSYNSVFKDEYQRNTSILQNALVAAIYDTADPFPGASLLKCAFPVGKLCVAEMGTPQTFPAATRALTVAESLGKDKRDGQQEETPARKRGRAYMSTMCGCTGRRHFAHERDRASNIIQ
jgi:hypothetical protein